MKLTIEELKDLYYYASNREEECDKKINMRSSKGYSDYWNKEYLQAISLKKKIEKEIIRRISKN